jgi:hypothetical protein
MTNLTQSFAPNALPPTAFYRAWQFFADPPLLELTLPTRTNASLLLYGRSGTNYLIQSASNLSPAAIWSPVADLWLTNSFHFVPINGPTNPAMFFRTKTQ